MIFIDEFPGAIVVALRIYVFYELLLLGIRAVIWLLSLPLSAQGSRRVRLWSLLVGALLVTVQVFHMVERLNDSPVRGVSPVAGLGAEVALIGLALVLMLVNELAWLRRSSRYEVTSTVAPPALQRLMKVEDLRERAEELDAQVAPVEAASAYEKLIQSGGGDISAHLNLAVLYFECIDFGYAAHHNLEDSFVRNSLVRAYKTLDQAEQKFGRYNEVDFWRYYFGFIYLGVEPDLDAVQEWLREGPSLIPLFHLLMLSSGDSVRRAAEELLESIQPARTERLRYVASVLESTIVRIDPQRAWRARRELREKHASEEEKSEKATDGEVSGD